MSDYGLFRVLLSLLWAGIIAYDIFARYDREVGNELQDDTVLQPYGNMWYLPIFLLFMIGLVLFSGAGKDAVAMFPIIFEFLVVVCVYDLFLVLCMPYLRRKISSRACASLWLIPGIVLTFFTTRFSFVEDPFVFYVPDKLPLYSIVIWFAGFLLFLGKDILQHLILRRSILKNTRPADSALTEIYNRECERMHLVKKPKLLVSGELVSPLTIGLFRKYLCVVLPEHMYREEELVWIFRHELVHILREDNAAKFYMSVLKAVCWINPFMTYAMRRSAEDTELSCDETVLLHADENQRKEYAELLLSAAGTDKGFTTCLSSKAESMCYRLKNVLHPSRTSSGALVVFVLTFLLCSFRTNVILAYGRKNIGEDLLHRSSGQVTVHGISDMKSFGDYVCTDEEGLLDYLGSLEVYAFAGENTDIAEEERWVILLDVDGQTNGMVLYDHFLKYTENLHETTIYYLPEEIPDEEMLRSLFLAPRMVVEMHDSDNAETSFMDLPAHSVLAEKDGETVFSYDDGLKIEETTGCVQPDLSYAWITLRQEICGPIRVEIEDRDGNVSRQVFAEEETEFRLDLNGEYRIVTVYTEEMHGDEKWNAVYRFRILEDSDAPDRESSSTE